MKMKIIKSATFFLILVFNSCKGLEEVWYYIDIKNDTDKSICVSAGCPGYLMNFYPDTSLPSEKPNFKLIEPKRTGKLISGPKWEDVINRLPSDTLSIYIFDYDTLNHYDWRVIKENYNILRHYELSVADLKNLNWTITYP
jgi:hypothetical protein